MNDTFKLLVILLVLLVAGCKSSKETAASGKLKKISSKVLETQIEKNAANFDWFSARIKMNYDDGKFSQSFNANIRFRKDSIIWMSLTGPFGIEGGRVLVTRDSIQIIDRLKKEHHHYPLSYIENYLPFSLTITDLQQILLGNSFLPQTGKQRVSSDKGKYYVQSTDNRIESQYWVYPKNYTYAEMRLKDHLENRQLLYKFDDYKEVEKKLVAYERSIEFINGKDRVKLDMNFTRIKVNEPLAFPFEVSSKYK